MDIPISKPSKKEQQKNQIRQRAILRDENEVLKLLIENYKLSKEWAEIQKAIAKEYEKIQKERKEQAKKVLDKAKQVSKKVVKPVKELPNEE